MSYSLTTLGLWTGLEDWQHRACVDEVVAEMQAQSYAARSIFRLVQVVGAFVAWRTAAFGHAPVQYNDIDCLITAMAPVNFRTASARR